MSPEDGNKLLFDPASILARLGSNGKDFNALVEETPGVDLSSILQQLSLHLPRLTREQNHSLSAVLVEAQRLAALLYSLRRDYVYLVPRWDKGTKLSDLALAVIDNEVAHPIFSRFHYLLSHRPGSQYLGLRSNFAPGWPIAVTSLSEFDLDNIAALVPELADPGTALVLSRVFAFYGTPHNTISHMLGEIRRYIRRTQPFVRALVTYVNPNLGFSGASYRADNWSLLGEEVGTTYLYVDGNYRTDRSLVQEFGTAQVFDLRERLGGRFETSRFELLPLSVYIRPIRHPDHLHQKPRHFPRWSSSGVSADSSKISNPEVDA